jgi:hypothetical protein
MAVSFRIEIGVAIAPGAFAEASAHPLSQGPCQGFAATASVVEATLPM